MYSYQYPRPSVAVSVILFDPFRREILIGKRSKNSDAFPSCLTIPGGFLDCKIQNRDDKIYLDELSHFYPTGNNKNPRLGNPEKIIRKGETTEQTAVREVFEETNLTINIDDLVLQEVRSDPNIDPRCHVIHVIYSCVYADWEHAKAGDDLEGLVWKSFDLILDAEENYAFDHYDILCNYIRKFEQ